MQHLASFSDLFVFVCNIIFVYYLVCCIQMYAKEQNDVELMEKIIKSMTRNKLPIQPGTADIIFR